jgi:hypothetical protein
VLTEPIVITILLLLLYNIENTTHAGCITILNIYFSGYPRILSLQSIHSRSQWLRVLRHELSSPAQNIGIIISNPIRGMNLCVCLFSICVVLWVGSSVATGWTLSKGSYWMCIRLRNWKTCEGPTKDCWAIIIIIITIPWPESASKLYRSSDRRMSAKFVPTFVDRGCRVNSATNPHRRVVGFLDRIIIIIIIII